MGLCPHTPEQRGSRAQSWYLGASYGNALLLQVQRLEQLLDSLRRRDTSWDCSGNTHTLLRPAEMGYRDSQSSQAPSKGSSSLVAPHKGAPSSALLSSSPCTALSQVPVQGLSSPEALSRMRSKDLQLQARFSPFCCHPWSGRALVNGQEVTQGTVPAPAPPNSTRCSPPAHLTNSSSHGAQNREKGWVVP